MILLHSEAQDAVGADPNRVVGYTSARMPALEKVPVTGLGEDERFEYPDVYRNGVMIDVIHDGAMIPREFLRDHTGEPIPEAQFWEDFVHERDWGAAMVAERMSARLNLEGYYRVNIARVLMDFGRFPGSTHKGAGHLDRFAISHPFSEMLSHDQKSRVLTHYYDRISAGYEDAVRGHFLKIAVHTYDKRNASGTVRPQVSIVTRSDAYQTHSKLPVGTFDPMFPDILVEFCADRILRDRISLTLERSGIPCEHNYPYALPEGSIEVRAQVWYFFMFLRAEFEAEFPDTAEDPAFQRVWDMLLDTNLRDARSDTLRSYIHMFRRAPRSRLSNFQTSRDAYFRIKDFLDRGGQKVVEQYRFSPNRPSTLGIEVRKDLVWELDDQDRPIRPRADMAARVGDTIAEAVAIYLRHDRRPHKPSREEFKRSGPWPEKEPGAEL